MQGSFDQSWEENIYSKNQQINKYPFGDLVSRVMRLFGKDLKAGKRLKVLEVGCGTGNNLMFLAKEGFQTFGLDGSKTACDLARRMLSEAGLSAEIAQGDICSLPFSDASFDLIIDRQAISANPASAVPTISSEIFRCLKPGAFFMSYVYTNDSGALKFDNPKALGDDTYTNFQSGHLAGTGVTQFFSDIRLKDSLFKNFEIIELTEMRQDQIIPHRRNFVSEFYALGRKPS